MTILLLHPEAVLADDPLHIGRVHYAWHKDILDPLDKHCLGPGRLHHEGQAVYSDLLLEREEVLFGHVQRAREHQCIGTARGNCIDVTGPELLVRVEFGHMHPVFPLHVSISSTYVVYPNKPVLRVVHHG